MYLVEDHGKARRLLDGRRDADRLGGVDGGGRRVLSRFLPYGDINLGEDAICVIPRRVGQ